MNLLDHGGASTERRDEAVERHNARIGMVLFILYLLIYGAYILVNVLAPRWMDLVPFWGLNLAVLWGMALILGALLLSLVYMALCRVPLRQELPSSPDKLPNDQEKQLP
jgi:uncharacterized membrane protein (DUF485 family)